MNFHIYLILFCGILGRSLVFGQTCGKVQVGRPNILGGNYVVHGAFPWVAVLINNEGVPFCGGTLLTKNKVLTAAHCIQGKGDTHEFLARDITVILGAHNLTKTHEQGKMTIGVQSIDTHREWNTKSASFDADIAILTLTDDVSFTRFIQPICLMSSDSEVAKMKAGYLAGYGKSEKNADYENILKSVEIPIANSNEECFYTNDVLVKISSIRTFCGGSRDGAGVCLGDSGNGLFIVHSQSYYLRGIVSASLYTNNDCDVHNHAIFTDVLKFSEWIVERIDDIDRPFVYGSSNTQVTLPRITTLAPRTTTNPSRKGAPSIIPIESPVEVTEGTNFELPCKSYGSPIPITRWVSASRADANVETNGNILTINNVSFRNSGKYTCEATNSEGKDSIDVFLVVRSASSSGIPPWESRTGSSINQIVSTQTPKQVKAAVGSRKEFKCTSDGNFRLDWRRADGRRLQSNAVSYNGVLVIDNCGYQDAGTYECIATDSNGNSAAIQSAKMEVVGGDSSGNRYIGYSDTSPAYGGLSGGSREAGGPKITFEPSDFATSITAGDQLRIRCVVSGAEPMTVNWGVIGRPSTSSSAHVNGNTIIFDRILMSDGGKYGCTASNLYGSTDKSFTLFVRPRGFL